MKAHETELGFLYLFFDLVILNISIVLMGWLSTSISVGDFREISVYLMQGNLSVFFTYFTFIKTNLYLSDGFTARVSRITRQTLIFLGVSALLSLLVFPHQYSKVFLLEYTILFFAAKLIFYWLLFKYLKIKRRKGINTKHAIIVGLNETSLRFRNMLESNRIMGYEFIGFVDDHGPGNLDLIGSPDDLESLIDQHHIEIIFVMMSIFSPGERVKEYLKICNRKGIHLRVVSDNQYLFNSRINRISVRGLVLINPQEIPLDNLASRIYKRLFDLAFASFSILFLFTWLFPVLMLLIKLSSKGPVFFKQKRTGINNQIFSCIKFRTMRVNASSDIQQATVNDSRITRTGNFMRRTHLDELPQFFNVFMGQMSVVGPRPHMLKHTEIYSDLVKNYLIRHYVKPGVTGWAQVSGYCGETDELWKMEKRVEYDLYYLENWTFIWDLKIIWYSVFSMKYQKDMMLMIRKAAV